MKTASCTKSRRMCTSITWSHRTYLCASINRYFTSRKTNTIGGLLQVPRLAAQALKAETWLSLASKYENRNSPDEVSVKTANVWPPTDCMVNGCSRGADTVLSSIPSITVSSSFKVKDTCKEQCHSDCIFAAPFLYFWSGFHYTVSNTLITKMNCYMYTKLS